MASGCAACDWTDPTHVAPHRLTVTSRRVVTPEGVRPAVIEVSDGKIVRVSSRDGDADDQGALDFGDLPILPGLVDTHVHINEPGRTDWEGFATASAAALSGGVTTLVDMPLNSVPVTTTPAALDSKRTAAGRSCRCDYGLWAGLVPANVGVLAELAGAGALGFKAFLVDSGIPDFPPVDETDLRRAMPVIAHLGLPLLVHAELPGPIAAATAVGARSSRHSDWASSRPEKGECEAIDLLAALAFETGCRVHIVHVSGAAAMARVVAGKLAGAPITAETCPHYLTLSDSEVPAGATEFKCAPPLRSKADVRELRGALAGGLIDMVASDHSPCPPDLKASGDFFAAWGGISSLGLTLSLVWSAFRSDPAGLERVARWLSTEPARLAGLAGRKGSLTPGMDADFAVFDPGATIEVTPAVLKVRHPVSPYLGRTLRGVVTDTFLRGVHVFSLEGEVPASSGQWLRPSS